MKLSDEQIERIVKSITENFRCFGGGRTKGAEFNPLVTWLKDKPAQFAAGVDVADVVRCVIAELNREAKAASAPNN